ncbi:Uncharacterised protein [BD1-7 clade bacterium]|uniref:Uncharacterized protein n=1 Tax=BD1-7 clade bacterium TaxID=2029982 RepID=A0A5S9PV31_9GAMM|nr:Uncharacterised protein [BD1-7 clade bacterium]
MYLFSCNATAKKDLAHVEVKKGDVMPFIVYIDFADLFGAEYLCKLYLLKEGFMDIDIQKRKCLEPEQVVTLKEKDADIQEALDCGYRLRMFDAH